MRSLEGHERSLHRLEYRQQRQLRFHYWQYGLGVGHQHGDGIAGEQLQSGSQWRRIYWACAERKSGGQTLNATSSPTTLIGGPNDILNGGAGADTFVFPTSFGSNTVKNFTPGTDALQFSRRCSQRCRRAQRRPAGWSMSLSPTIRERGNVAQCATLKSARVRYPHRLTFAATQRELTMAVLSLDAQV